MSRSQNLIEYFFITLLIYASGSIYFVSFHYNVAIPFVFVLAVLYWLFKPNRTQRFRIKSSFVLIVVLAAFCMVTVITINNSYRLTPYIAILLQIMIGYFLSDQIRHNDFIYKYTKVIFVFSVISIVLFTAMLIYPSIILFFPKTVGQGSVDYYNAFVHVFESAKGFSALHTFKRNAGIFWEPGAYQAFVNLALFFLLSKKDFGKQKSDVWMLSVFTITIVTTYSVTGYIVWFLLILFNFNKIKKIFSKNSIIGLLFVVISVFVVVISNIFSVGGSFISDKFVSSFGSERKFVNRLYLSDISFLFESPFAFLGISFEKYESLSSGSANSLIHTMVSLGVPFTLILLYMYLKSSVLFRNSFLFFLILLLFFSAESLLWRPLFLCIAWYGLLNCNAPENYEID